MSEERAVLPKEVQPGYLVTGKAPKHTHTQEWRDMERDTHRVMHTKIKRGGGKRKEGEDD